MFFSVGGNDSATLNGHVSQAVEMRQKIALLKKDFASYLWHMDVLEVGTSDTGLWHRSRPLKLEMCQHLWLRSWGSLSRLELQCLVPIPEMYARSKPVYLCVYS